MLYYITRTDTLQKIANKFNVSQESIMNANVICNPNYITAGMPLIIPDRAIPLPKSQGQEPYYITNFGDTFLCLSGQFNTSVEALIYMNKLHPNAIPTGHELLVGNYMANPYELKEKWDALGKYNCANFSQEQINNIFYKGSFIWQALGNQSISFLLELLENPCDIVRYYAVVSLGRIAPNNNIVYKSLVDAVEDPSNLVSQVATRALRRIELVRNNNNNKRMHVVIVENRLYDEPNLKSNSIPVAPGDDIMSLNWAIPSPIGEKSPTGNTLIFDYVRMFNTGRNGYIPRLGFNEINVI